MRQHRPELEARQKLTMQQKRALSAIAMCRTAALGGHLEACRSCGHEHAAYNSCRNRHCPKCQALAQEQWIAARSERILPMRHFHVVFTLPSQLRPLARFRPKLLFDALLRASSDTLLQLGQSRQGALLGVTMVLHTWTRELQLHPHIHAIVTAGGLSLDDENCIRCCHKYLFAVEVMGQVFCGKFMALLRQMHGDGHLQDFDDFQDPQGFDRLMCKLASLTWLVYAKKTFRRARDVIGYLGRYTHRVAICNSRLVDVTTEHVTFCTKKGKTASIPPVEFLARFVQHVLPAHFVKIRHYGLYAACHVHTKLAHTRALLHPDSQSHAPSIKPHASCFDQLRVLTGRDVRRCPVCGGEMIRVARIHPSCRAPPAS